MEPPTTGTKLCTSCSRLKSVLAFAVDKKNADGLHRACRECANTAHRQSASYRRLREREAERRTIRAKAFRTW
jgi:hypothetical protein